MRLRFGVLTVALLVAGCRATGGPQPQAVHHARKEALNTLSRASRRWRNKPLRFAWSIRRIIRFA